jgi:hypothetical protein
LVLACFQSAFAQICVVETYAGIYGSANSFSGDGGDATSAKFGMFSLNGGGIWVDTSEMTFIADYINNRVRVVNYNTKVVSTIAGL